eukprot:scaffold749_cov193-Alexandrium_tamarense.AAC.6
MALQILAAALLASSSPITTAAFHMPSLIGTKHHLPSQIIRRELMASTSSSHDDDPSTSTSPAPSFQYTQLQDNTSSSSQISYNRDLQHVLTTIETAAYQAGQLALQTAGKIAIKSTKANIRDLVTESDLACQVVIRDTIMKEFRNDVFLGEEDVETGDLASSEALRMALGVASQSREGGVADEGEDLSIGVVSLAGEQPQVVAGVIYNPLYEFCYCLLSSLNNAKTNKTLGEMTSAVRGRGCYLNNRRINPSSKDRSNTQQQPRQSILSQSLINVGFPVCKESTLLASSCAVTALATNVRGLRMIASASQTMAWVAHSKLNAYFSWDLNAWDVAAGMVIVEESGGLVSNFDGSDADISSRDMIITCCPDQGEDGLLRDELIQVLRESDCLRY